LPLKTNVNNILGKPVNDPYGRYFGRIVGFDATSKGEITKIGIERANGDFSIYPIKQISIQDDLAIFTYSWKIKAQDTLKELDLTLRKITALNQLFESGEVTREFYEKNRKEKEEIINNILKTRKNLATPLTDRIQKLDNQIVDMQSYLTNLKLEHFAAEIEDSVYKNVSDAIQGAINRSLQEKSDLESAIQPLMRSVSILPPIPDKEFSEKSSRPLVLRIKEAIS